jgi:hypothetical protein
MSANPSVVVSRTRNARSEPLGIKGSGDALWTAGIIAGGAVGGYFLTDYIIKNNILDDILAKLGLSTTGPEPAPQPEPETTEKTKTEESKQAYIMTPLGPELIGEMIDRDSRQNSAYLAAKKRQFNEPDIYVDEGLDVHNTNEGDFNQIVTDDDVFFHY